MTSRYPCAPLHAATYGRAAVIRTQDYTALQAVAIDHSATARYVPTQGFEP